MWDFPVSKVPCRQALNLNFLWRHISGTIGLKTFLHDPRPQVRTNNSYTFRTRPLMNHVARDLNCRCCLLGQTVPSSTKLSPPSSGTRNCWTVHVDLKSCQFRVPWTEILLNSFLLILKLSGAYLYATRAVLEIRHFKLKAALALIIIFSFVINMHFYTSFFWETWTRSFT